MSSNSTSIDERTIGRRFVGRPIWTMITLTKDAEKNYRLRIEPPVDLAPSETIELGKISQKAAYQALYDHGLRPDQLAELSPADRVNSVQKCATCGDFIFGDKYTDDLGTHCIECAGTDIEAPTDEPTRIVCSGSFVEIPATEHVEPDPPLKWNDRKCRVCGCDDEHACNPACFWIESDLCSACYESMPAPVTGGDHVATIEPLQFARICLKSEVLATLSEAALLIAEMARDADDKVALNMALRAIDIAHGEPMNRFYLDPREPEDTVFAMVSSKNHSLGKAAERILQSVRSAWDLAA